MVSDPDFQSLTLPSLIADYKDEKNEWIDEWVGMKEMELWVNGGMNEWTRSQQKKYNLCVNIEWTN